MKNRMLVIRKNLSIFFLILLATVLPVSVAFSSTPEVVSLSYSPTTISTENGGTSTLTATLSSTPSGTATISLSFSGNATSNTDYTFSSNTISFGSTDTTGSIVITSLGDSIYETDETFMTSISAVSNATTVSGAMTATLSITDEQSAPTVSLSVGTTTSTAVDISENGGATTIFVTLSNATSSDVFVSLSNNGSAATTADYTLSASSITISAEATSGSISLVSVADSLYETSTGENHTIEITSLSGGGATAGTTQSISVGLLENLSAPGVSLSASPTSFLESAGTSVVTVDIGTATTEDVLVSLSYGGTATSNSDYSGANDSVTISASKTNTSFTIAAIDDNIFGGTDTLSIAIDSISGGGAAASGTQSLELQIIDSSPEPTVSLSVNSPIDENGGTSTVTATLSNARTTDVVVSLSYGGTATSGSDYSVSASSITISAESTTGSITVTSIDDSLYEASTNETVIVGISSLTNATTSSVQSKTLSITDDESLPIVELSTSLSTISENGGASTFTVTLSNNAATQDVVVYLSYSGTAGLDANANASTSDVTLSLADSSLSSITIDAGSTTNSFIVTGVDDSTYEGPETFTATISSVSNGTTASTQSQSISVTDDEPAPTVSLSASSVTIKEGASSDDTGLSTATSIIVSLSHTTTVSVAVDLSYSGNASSSTYTNASSEIVSADFSAASSVTISAGDTSSSFTLTSIDDSIYEASTDTFSIGIGSISGGGAAESGTQSLDMYISEDESPPQVSLSASSISIAEAAGTSAVYVTMDNATTVDVVVSLSYSGTATNNTDFSGGSESVTISSGSTGSSYVINATSDSLYEVQTGSSETFSIDISSVSGGGAAESGTQTLNLGIIEDESAPTATLSISSDALAEDGGTSTITVSLSSTPLSESTVSLSFSGTATTGTDYSASASTITIGTSATTGSITLTSIDDNLYEASTNETIIVGISSLTNATSSGQSKTLSIVEDESLPTVELSVTSNTISENGGATSLVATLSNNATTQDVVVYLSYSGTAKDLTSSSDVTVSTVSGSGGNYITNFTISAESTTNALVITGIDDSAYEGTETFTATISSVTNATTSSTISQSISITDDEAATAVSLSATNVTIAEGASSDASSLSAATSIIVSLSHATASDVVVVLSYSGNASSSTYTNANSESIAADFSGATTSLSINNGDTSSSFVLRGLSDSIYEGETSESFSIDIESVTGSGAAESGTQSLDMYINEDESAPQVSLSASSISIAEAADTSTVYVTMDTATTVDVVVSLSYSGNATSNTDFSSASESVTISSGNTVGSYVINATSDSLYEVETGSSETFAIDISSISGGGAAESGTQTLNLGIIEDDSAPTVSMSGDDSIAENGGTGTITVSLSNATSSDVIVAYTFTSSGTQDTDWSTSETSTTISAGATTASFTLTAISDDIYEGTAETIEVSIDTVSGGGATENGAQSKTVTITEDDGAAVVSLSVNNTSFSENAGESTVTATLDNLTTSSVTVNLSYNGNATSNTDFSAVDSISISAGAYTGTVTLTGTDDSTYEANETFSVSIGSVSSSSSVAESGTQSLDMTVTDDESAPSVSIGASPETIAEDGGVSILTVSMSNATTVDVAIHLSYTGTATSGGTDYDTPETSLTISTGTTSTTTTVTSKDDGNAESNETIVASIDSVSGGGSSENGEQSTTISVTDDDTPIATLSVDSVALTENGGTSVVTVTLSNTPASDATVGLSFSGTATTGTDYSVSSSSITIGTSTTSGSITVTSIGDNLYESSMNETIVVDINSLTNATTSASQAKTLSITEDETEPIITLSASPTTISENGGASTLTVTLSNNATTQDVVVNLSYSGVATSNTDYTAATSITISAESTSNTATITSTADSIYEGPDETFTVDISSVTNATTNNSSQARTLTIDDNESAPTVTLSVSSESIAENAGASTVTIALNNATTSDVTVHLSYTGTAQSGTDYESPASSVTIGAGSTTITTTLTAISDSAYEGATETVIIDVDSVSGGGASESTAQQKTVSIVEDYSSPKVNLSLSASSLLENSGSTLTVSTTLDTATSSDVTVSLSYGGTASSGTDYGTPSATITISSATTSGSTTIDLTDDSTYEADETIEIEISGVSGGGATENGTQKQTFTITEDESVPVVSLSGDSAMAEADGTATVIATLNVATSADVVITLGYSTTGTGGSGVDFSEPATTMTISTGATTGSITLTALSDSIYEGSAEVITVSIDDVSGGGATESDTQTHDVSITEDDSQPAVTLSASSNTIVEASGASTLTATLTGATSADVTVTLSYSNSTATSGTDFTGATSISISAGSTTGTTTITATQDTESENDETIVVEVSEVSGGGAAENSTEQSQTITITDDDSPTVSLSLSPSTVAESTTEASTVTATLNKAHTSDVTVGLSYTGTATSGTDYTVSATTVTISVGATTGIALVTAIKDSLYEGSSNETTIVDIVSLTNGTTNSAQARTMSITDGDSAPSVTLSASSNVIAEASGASTLTATLSVATTSDVTVNFSYSGTAESGTDYGTPASSVTISAGSTTGTVVVTVIDDSTHESEAGETIIVTVSEVSGGGSSIDGNAQSQTITITEASDVPSVYLSVASPTIVETDGTTTLTVQLGSATTAEVTVELSYSGTASSVDYGTSASVITISAGSTTGIITVSSLSDSIYDPGETIVATISSVSGGNAIAGSSSQSQTMTITDDESAPNVSLSVADSSIAEASGATTLTATLSNATTVDVMVSFSYSNSTATSGTDFTGTTSLTISAGSTTGTASVSSLSDSLYDPNEIIQAEISEVSSGGASENGSQSKEVTINEASDAPTVSLSVDSDTIAEASGATTLTAELTVATTVDVTINLSYSNGTATNGMDFTGATSLTIGAGTTKGTTTLNALSDAIYDPDETIVVEVDTVSGGGASENSTAQLKRVTITDDETAPKVTLSAIPNSIVEASGASTLTVSLSVATTVDVSVYLSYTGTATSGLDYSTPANSMTIGSGSTSNSMTLRATGDTIHENDETIIVDITEVSGGGASEDGTQTTTVALTDDDSEPTVDLTIGSASISETSGTTEVMATLSHASTMTVTVQLTYSGTGVKGTDYNADTSIVISAGSTSNSLTLSAVHDAIDENNETIVVDIASVSGGIENGVQQVGTSVVDDDDPPTVTMVASPLSIAEAGEASTLTFSLSSVSAKEVTVHVTPGGTASSTDYTMASSTTIAVGNTTGTIVLTATPDDSSELNETVIVDIASINNGTESGVQQQTITIVDDEPPLVTLSVDKTSIVENGGVALITATLLKTSTSPVTVNLNFSGSALSTDYSAANSIVVSPGTLSNSITLTASQDSVDEGEETVTVGILSLVNGNEGSSNQASITITDDDTAGITVGAISGNTSEDGASATFTVVLNTQPVADVTIAVSSTDSTEGSVSPQSLKFNATNWNVAQVVTVRGIDDLVTDTAISYTILVAPAVSIDSNYLGMDAMDVTVINDDNDTAGFIVSEVQGTLKEDAETPTTASFTVRLKTSPTADVTLDLRITDVTEGSYSDTQVLDKQSLTFTQDNWQVDRTIIVFSVDESDDDGDVDFQVLFENLASTDSNYTEAGNETITLSTLARTFTTIDNDSAGILVGAVEGKTSEDGKSFASVPVSLKTQPAGEVTITVNSADTGEVVVNPAHLTFTTSNWVAPQTVQLTGVNDNDVDGAQTVEVTFQADASYENVQAIASVINEDDDTAGLVLGTISGNTKEDGSSSNFTVRLATQPSAGENITVVISSSDESEGKADRAQVIFTHDNWNSDQTVLVFGVDDDIRDGKVGYQIILNAQSSTGIGDYQGLTSEVALENEDDEVVGVVLSKISNPVEENGKKATFTARLQLLPTADVTIHLVSSDADEGTVSPSSLTFTTENWRAEQTVTVVGVRGGIGVVDGNQSFIVQSAVTSTDDDYASLSPGSVDVVNLDVDKAGVVQGAVIGKPTEDGDTAEFTLSLLSAPQGNVAIDVSSSNDAEGKATPPRLTFTTTNWSSPQKIVVQGQNEAQGADTIDGAQQFFVNLAVNQTDTADEAYDALIVDGVELFNQDNDSAAFVVSEVTGNVRESDVIPQSFTVKLSSQPANNSTVTVTLRSSDTTEGTVDTNLLTFTTENWSSEHKVNVSALNDNDIDGDQSFFIHFERAQSNDNNYLLTPPSVLVVNEDDDNARILVSDLEGTVREDGSTASFKVQLGSQPTGNVMVQLSVATASADEVSISKSSLTFTDKSWNAGQTVVVTGLADGILDGDQTFVINMTVDGTGTTDTNYSSLLLADMTGLNEDIDVAGLVFSENNPNTSEDGEYSNFTLRLRSQPTGNVFVNLSVTNTNEAQLGTSSLTFDDKTWSADQTVVVVGLDDDQQDNDQKYYIELTVADSSEDSLYHNIPVVRIPFVNEDNDVSNFIVTPINQNTQEDGTAAEFKVRLSTLPSGEVTLPFELATTTTSSLFNNEVSLSTDSLTFTTENWKANQRVVLRGVDDQDTDGDQTFTVLFKAAQSTADANYHGKLLDPLQGINEDDDLAEFMVTPLNRTIDEDGTDSFFQLRLRSLPAEGATVKVGFQVVGEDTALPTLSVSELEFNRSNWKSWQKVRVIGQDDNAIDGDQPFKIVFSPVVSPDSNYSGFVIPTQEGITNDNDSGGIAVSDISGNVTEGRKRAHFTLKLRSQPASDVTVNLSIEEEKDSQGSVVIGEGSIVPGDETVVFTSSNWNAEQSVRVAGVNDDFKDGDQRFKVLFDSVVSGDDNYNGLQLEPMAVINEDDDISGFIISDISRPVREDGTTATFKISLRSRPQSENQGSQTVQVNLSSSDLTEGTVEPSSITFSSDDWRAQRRVRVTGIDDTEGSSILDGDQSFRIDFTSAVSEDADYHGLIPDSVTVVNLDEDVPEFIVSPVVGQTSEDGDRAQFTVRLRTQPEAGAVVTLPISSSNEAEAIVSPSQLIFNADNFSGSQTVTITGMDDATAIQDGDQRYTIVLAAAEAGDSTYHGVDPDDIELFNKDNESAGFVIGEITGDVSEDGLEEYIAVRLRTQPTGTVTIPVRSSQVSEGKAKVTQLIFNQTNWDADQVIGVVGQDEANLDAQVADGNQPFQILLAPEVDPENAACTTDPSLIECRLTVVSDDSNYHGLVAGEVDVINLDNDHQGIVIGPLSGNVSEDGGKQSFFVRLRSNPQDTVILDLSSTDLEEVTVSPATLTYDADNWRGQQLVTVTGVDDVLSDQDQLTTVKVDVASNSSAYLGVLGEEVEVINEDNDVADILVSTIDGNTGEDGAAATFTVRLQSQPSANVSLTLASSDNSEGTVSPSTLVFTNSDWDALQTVRVTGVDDLINDGDSNYQINFSASASDDNNYVGLAPNPVSVINLDNEKPGFIVSEPTNATREDGTQSAFGVRLSSPPTAGSTVSIELQSSNSSEGQIYPTTLFFNENNWNANQVVTVIGQDEEQAQTQPDGFINKLLSLFFKADAAAVTDGTKDGDQAYQVVFGQTGSTDPNYRGITPDRLRLVNEDDDTAGYIFSEVEGTINENGSKGSFKVELRTAPVDSIALNIVSSDIGEGLVSPSQMVFTSENWNAAQTVTITGVNDDLSDGSRPVEISLTVASAGADSNYAALENKTVAVTNEDNDSAGLVISAISGQASEGGETSSFTVSLQSQPGAGVQVDLNGSNDAELQVLPKALAFDTNNWNVPQTITLTGQDEAVEDGNQTVRISLTTTASADVNYAALVVPFLEATNEDNDIADFLISDLSVPQLREGNALTSTFSLSLKTQPTSNVNVALGLSKGKEDEISFSSNSLLFTTENWNHSQTVSLTAQDDDLADGDQIVGVVGTTTSTDENYNNRVAVNLSIVNRDNDQPGVETTPVSVSVDEGGQSSFAVSLSTEPANEVVLTFSSSDTSLGSIETTGATSNTLTFDANNWSVDQNVTVNGGSISNSQNFEVAIASASDDSDYNNLLITSVLVSVQSQPSLIVDNRADLVIAENAITLEGISYSQNETFSVRLKTKPTADVMVNLRSANTNEVTVSPEVLTFTNSDWDTTQTVTLSAVDDVRDDGDQNVLIQGTVSSDDSGYNAVTFTDLSVMVKDDDEEAVEEPQQGSVGLDEEYESSLVKLGLSTDDLLGSVVEGDGSASTKIYVHTPTGTSGSDVSQTTTIFHKLEVGGKKAGLEGIVEAKNVANPSTVYLEGSAQAHVSDSATFVGKKKTTHANVISGIDSAGGIAIAVTPTNNSSVVLLPETPVGADATISETSVVIVATLADNIAGAPRVVSVDNPERWYYMGRSVSPVVAENGKVVYLRGKAGGSITITRLFTETTTTIEVTGGTVEVRIGDASAVEQGVGYSVTVNNSVYGIELQTGRNFISIGSNSTISPAELELKLLTSMALDTISQERLPLKVPLVHSFWRWNYVSSAWQTFSPDATTYGKLRNDLGVSPFSTDIQVSEGIWIYAESGTKLYMHDKEPGKLVVDDSVSGWHLVGNDTAVPIRVDTVLSSFSNIQSVWLPEGNSWKVYASDSSLLELVKTDGTVTLMDGNTMIAAGNAFWVEVNTVPSSAREARTQLNAPPALGE